MDRDRLLDLALTALEEITQTRRYVPIGKPVALRFLLAYLFAESGQPDRFYFDRYWTLCALDDPFFHDIDLACTYIHRAVGRQRVHEQIMTAWGRAQRRYRPDGVAPTPDASADTPATVPDGVPAAILGIDPDGEPSPGFPDASGRVMEAEPPRA